jgi:hypothetical protein
MKEFYVKKSENLDVFINAFRSDNPEYSRVEIVDQNNAWKVQFTLPDKKPVVEPAKNPIIEEPESKGIDMSDQKKDSSIGEVMAAFVKAQYADDLAQFRQEMNTIQKNTVAEAQKAKAEATAAIDGINKAVQNGIAQMTGVIDKTEQENRAWREEQSKKLAAIESKHNAEAQKRTAMAKYLKGLPE